MWEDAANKQGGRWVITLNRCPKTELDNLWLDVVSFILFYLIISFIVIFCFIYNV